MRTLKRLFRYFVILTFVGLVIGLYNSCEDPAADDLYLEETISNEGLYPWQDLLQQLDMQSDIMFVQSGESIQDVLNDAKSGSVIYIEPGSYQEEISTNKTDIKLIGFSLDPDDLVIKNAEKGNIEIVNLYEKGSFNNLQNKSFRNGKRSCLRHMTREDLGGGIAHYQFDIAMGSGEFDVVTIHRVVKENRAYKPIRTKGHVFMVHGAIQDFDDIFLTAGAETINAETSSPYFLASNKIDVWGIDMGWTKVPMETTDFSFMEGWGVEKDVTHALKAMSIARLIRGLTRQGFSRMNLLGFSYGVDVAYGAANRETQQHWYCRDVKGIIPVDRGLKSEDVNVQANNCDDAFDKKTLLNSPKFEDPWGVGLINAGNLALSNPDGDSPFYPGITNSQFMVFAGSQGFFSADQNGYLYSDPMRFINLSVNLSPYWPMQVNYELNAIKCPSEDVSYDDHFSEISVPIFYIGAEMAAGQSGVYTSSLTSSSDITNHIVPGYSHADLWFAYNADELVWSPLRDWIKNHK